MDDSMRFLLGPFATLTIAALLTACSGDDARTGSDAAIDGTVPPDDAAASDASPTVCGTPDQFVTLPYTASDLEGCTSFLGSIHVPDASSLDVVAPLAPITHIGGRLTFFRNHVLPDLSGIANLETIGGVFSVRLDDSRGSFTSLAGASSLREVGELEIQLNPWLRTLSGLDALEVVHGDVRIEDNAMLPQSEIDAFLARVRVEGAVTVSGNAP